MRLTKTENLCQIGIEVILTKTNFYRYYPRYKNGEITKAELGRLCRLSRSSVYRYLDIIEGIDN